MRLAPALVVAVVLAAVAALLAGAPGVGGGAGEGSGPGVEREPDPVGDALGDDVAAPVREVLSGAEVRRRESELSLVEEGERVLEEYRSRGDCLLVEAGYLDLMGRTWACVTKGEGWVELCLVRESGDGGGSSVVTWHMDAGDVDVGELAP